MKHSFVYLLGLLCWVPDCRAQNAPKNAGIYCSADDFRARRLTLATDCDPVRLHVRLHEWPARSYITVVRSGQKDTVSKTAVYGYRDCDGREYRLVGDQRLPILNPTEEVLLYRVEQPTVGKNPGYVRLYFSTSAASTVKPLTVYNLKRAFPTNYRLHHLLDTRFPHGRSLADQETFHGMTVLNWLVRYSLVEAQAQ